MSKLKNTVGLSIQKKNGFTIAKTFVAIIAIGILITLALPRFLSHLDFTRSAEARIVTGLTITATRTSNNGGNDGDTVVVTYGPTRTVRSGTGAFASIK
ncbi:MAG: type II secretion system protein [Candidatus Omnitrophica bacterium]|nr:type II secretion system protein [Candidatus Omnitrophota bacterium]